VGGRGRGGAAWWWWLRLGLGDWWWWWWWENVNERVLLEEWDSYRVVIVLY
jgi:hypothetical protein